MDIAKLEELNIKATRALRQKVMWLSVLLTISVIFNVLQSL